MSEIRPVQHRADRGDQAIKSRDKVIELAKEAIQAIDTGKYDDTKADSK